MKLDRSICIAPMMAYTDRHYRVLMRLVTRRALLYTEMVTTASLLHGDASRHLAFSPIERPLALQLGGNDPQALATCAQIATAFGYDEINLNVGCPSNRVSSGQFGACLMKQPALVAECVAAMRAATALPVTVKTRLGVDQQDSYEALQQFITTVAQAGCETFIVHARKAWLKGLSPRQNRNVPPLRYESVYQLKRDFPALEIIINGGIKTQSEIAQHLQFVDGVMIGREAYHNPLFLSDEPNRERSQLVLDYLAYMRSQLEQGVTFWKLSRHLMNIFQGQRGAKQWRRLLSSQNSEDKIVHLENLVINNSAEIAVTTL
jgi:tRNA-dihydrouridine synthase A